MASLALLAGVADAQAGAWVHPSGRGVSILTVEQVSADLRFERDRSRVAADRFERREARLLVEYGLTDRVTLRAKTAYGGWQEDGAVPRSARGFGVHEAGVRVGLFERGGLVASGEATARVAQGFADEGTVLGGEARLLAGYGFALAERPAFVDAQVGYRWGDGPLLDEAVLDLTVGVRPFDRALLLLQTFSAIATAPEGLRGADRHRAQASLVLDLDERWSLEAGAGTALAGADGLDERSLFAAIWLRF